MIAEETVEFAAPWIGKQIEALIRAGDRPGEQRMRQLNERILQLRHSSEKSGIGS